VTQVILQLFPGLTDVNGDAQNALVLARRAAWAGVDADVLPVPVGGPVPGARPAVVVLGSSTDSALPRVREALEGARAALEDWLGEGVPVLAVGTGLELLAGRVVLEGVVLEGLGLLPGESHPLAARVADDLVVDAPGLGRLVGYENHVRGLRLEQGVQPLGTVVRGVGDGHGVDGVRHGSLLGTRLHGPVLAKNPAFADAVLSQAFGRPVTPAGRAAAAADAAAAAVRRKLLGAQAG
jgi:CobQ-like glutamine amidotransferase family enzyme